MSGQTFGSFEVVSLPELQLHDVLAKVDTGAYSGAIHCTDIVVAKNSAGKRELSCHPAGKKDITFSTTKYAKTAIMSATGHRVTRYVITTEIIIKGVSYNLMIGLSDRSDLKCPVLIGRRFLREQGILVDVSQNAHYDTEGTTTS